MTVADPTRAFVWASGFWTANSDKHQSIGQEELQLPADCRWKLLRSGLDSSCVFFGAGRTAKFNASTIFLGVEFQVIQACCIRWVMQCVYNISRVMQCVYTFLGVEWHVIRAYCIRWVMQLHIILIKYILSETWPTIKDNSMNLSSKTVSLMRWKRHPEGFPKRQDVYLAHASYSLCKCKERRDLNTKGSVFIGRMRISWSHPCTV